MDGGEGWEEWRQLLLATGPMGRMHAKGVALDMAPSKTQLHLPYLLRPRFCPDQGFRKWRSLQTRWGAEAGAGL